MSSVKRRLRRNIADRHMGGGAPAYFDTATQAPRFFGKSFRAHKLAQDHERKRVALAAAKKGSVL